MENRSSSTAESEKMLKIGFRPWPTNEKQRKLAFGHGRRVENSKNTVSAVAEMLKMTKNAFRPRPKGPNIYKSTVTRALSSRPVR